ncbi:UNVERIFIED_CONTAM: protein kinase, putative [Hammondia hammondi]|eukprot:XP_008888455.1 protein kinase, putative [Hammondia hammondi]
MGCTQSGHRSFNDDYLMGQKIATGTFTQTRLCTDRRTGEVRAAKIRSQPYLEADCRFEAALLTELNNASHSFLLSRSQTLSRTLKSREGDPRTTRGIDHVLRFFGAYAERTFFCEVFELCQGGELMSLNENEETTEADVARWIRQLLMAIETLHLRSIVHRNVNPSNVLLLEATRRTVKLGGFGLACRVPSRKLLKEACGSRAYLAPEMLIGNYGRKVDVWAVGVILYVFLFGRLPFAAADTYHLFKSIIEEEPEWTYTPTRDLQPGSTETLQGTRRGSGAESPGENREAPAETVDRRGETRGVRPDRARFETVPTPGAPPASKAASGDCRHGGTPGEQGQPQERQETQQRRETQERQETKESLKTKAGSREAGRPLDSLQAQEGRREGGGEAHALFCGDTATRRGATSAGQGREGRTGSTQSDNEATERGQEDGPGKAAKKKRHALTGVPSSAENLVQECLAPGKAATESTGQADTCDLQTDDDDYAPSAEAVDLCKQLLTKNFLRRPTATEALSHPWIQREAWADGRKGLTLPRSLRRRISQCNAEVCLRSGSSLSVLGVDYGEPGFGATFSMQGFDNEAPLRHSPQTSLLEVSPKSLQATVLGPLEPGPSTAGPNALADIKLHARRSLVSARVRTSVSLTSSAPGQTQRPHGSAETVSAPKKTVKAPKKTVSAPKETVGAPAETVQARDRGVGSTAKGWRVRRSRGEAEGASGRGSQVSTPREASEKKGRSMQSNSVFKKLQRSRKSGSRLEEAAYGDYQEDLVRLRCS